jgi:hypothetical protein
MENREHRIENLTKIGSVAFDLGAPLEKAEQIHQAIAYVENKEGLTPWQLRVLDEARADLNEALAETGIQLGERELAAVLAGLRLVQAEMGRGEFLPQGVHSIFDDDGTITPLDTDEIDALCERING